MKVAILILASILAVQAFTEEQQKRLVKLSRQCPDVSKVDLKILDEAEKGTVLADDPKLKVHISCFAKKIGVQNEKGEILTDVIRQRLNSQMKDKAKVEKVIKQCVVPKDTPEDTAISVLGCLRGNIDKDVAFF